MITLRGMAWAHDRALGPLRAAAARFENDHAGEVSVEWEARSLTDFEEYPLEILAQQYDLITIDHPFVGTASRTGALRPLEEVCDPSFLAGLATDAVGLSASSYDWDGHVWAAPIDAAAQVSAAGARAEATIGTLPRTWAEVVTLLEAQDLTPHVVLPSNPVHALSSLYSLAHQLASERAGRQATLGDWWDEGGPEAGIVTTAADLLLRLIDRSHPASLDLDPIDALELMASDDAVVYSPLIFGYCPYSRVGYRARTIGFHPAPALGSHGVGTLLGGVGLAISSSCAHPDLAARLVEAIAAKDFQSGEYVTSGGQPGRLSAWNSAAANSVVDGFFERTLPTVSRAFLRPRLAGYPAFQRAASHRLHDQLASRSAPTRIAHELRTTWNEVMG